MTTHTTKTPRVVTLSIRDLGHFASAFLASFIVSWKAAGAPIHSSALWALAPAAATVAFRQVFPNLGTTEVSTPVDPTTFSAP